MTVVTHIYNAYLNDMLTAANSWTAASVKVALFTAISVYTASDTTYNATGTEVSTANGYTQNTLAIATRTVTGTTTQAAKITSADGAGSPSAGTAQWVATSTGFSAVGAKLYVSGGHPIADINFGGTQTASGGGTFTITWDPNGVIQLASS